MVIFVSIVLESDSDSYDKESRKQKDMISACWILLAPITIIYLIINYRKDVTRRIKKIS